MALVSSDRKIGYFPSYILQRIRNHMNFVCAAVGGTGTGKSYSLLKLGELLDPDFDIRNICFTEKQFMNLCNGVSKKLHPGSVIIWDEMQVTMGHLDYQSFQAKAINYILQTFRHRNFILFVSTPNFNFINASARKLFHGIIETQGIDRKKKEVILKPLLLQINMRRGDIYYKFLRVAKGGSVMPLKRIRVGLANPDLIKQYEVKKGEFTKQLNDDLIEELEEREAKKHKALTEKQKNVLIDLLDNKKIEQIAEDRKISFQSVYDHIRFIKKKGVKIVPVKEGKDIIRYDISGHDHLL